MDCPFCHLTSSHMVHQTNNACVIKDQYPVTPGHCLIVPFRHVADFFELNLQEYSEIIDLLHTAKTKLSLEDRAISGFNVGVNIGASAGQTIFHCHIHLIPRRDGDLKDPRGGVRGVIPDKRIYGGDTAHKH